MYVVPLIFLRVILVESDGIFTLKSRYMALTFRELIIMEVHTEEVQPIGCTSMFLIVFVGTCICEILNFRLTLTYIGGKCIDAVNHQFGLFGGGLK